MTVIRDQDAVTHRLHGSAFHSFVSPSSGSTQLCAWRLEVAPGTIGVPHRINREEVLLVLSGELAVAVDDERSTAHAGDVVRVPAGARFGVDNPGTARATAWVTTTVGLEATLADGSSIRPPWTR